MLQQVGLGELCSQRPLFQTNMGRGIQIYRLRQNQITDKLCYIRADKVTYSKTGNQKHGKPVMAKSTKLEQTRVGYSKKHLRWQTTASQTLIKQRVNYFNILRNIKSLLLITKLRILSCLHKVGVIWSSSENNWEKDAWHLWTIWPPTAKLIQTGRSLIRSIYLNL